MTKNSNLAITITGIFYTYPDVPISITNHGDRFHKDILYDDTKILWTQIYATPGSASFEEKEKETDAGLLYDQKLKFTYPGEDDSNTESFDAVRRPVIVKITFNKGLPKMFGCLANPAKFERILKTSAKDSTSECAFTCLSPEPAWWITADQTQIQHLASQIEEDLTIMDRLSKIKWIQDIVKKFI